MSAEDLAPELVARFAAYFAKHPAWGALHTVLDDGNVEDFYVGHAVGWARDRGDVEGEELAKILLTMSESQRDQIGRRAEEASR